jgi:formamidopyrimidine-DNA glycosylase
MPEGPEVRTNRDMLAETLEGKIMHSLDALSGKLERKGIPGHENFAAYLPSKVVEVRVRGKSILILLENGAGIHSTLGMAGWWYPHVDDTATLTGKAYANGALVDIKEVVAKAYKHSRVAIVTEKGPAAVFCDMRNFGNMTCYTPDELKINNPLDKLGLDLLNEAPKLDNFNFKWLAKKAPVTKSRNNKPIGELLLDQEFACGLGNIYRAEVLYIARILPTRKLSELSMEEWNTIGHVAMIVLGIAYETQGVMNYPGWLLQRFLGFHVADDYEYKHHLVYGRSKDPRGNPIVAKEVGGRTMWYCPEIQR